MKKVKLVIIHLADMIDYYVLHRIFEGPLVNYLWDNSVYDKMCDYHNRFCTKICLSKWWGDRCDCRYCKSHRFDLEE